MSSSGFLKFFDHKASWRKSRTVILSNTLTEAVYINFLVPRIFVLIIYLVTYLLLPRAIILSSSNLTILKFKI